MALWGREGTVRALRNFLSFCARVASLKQRPLASTVLAQDHFCSNFWLTQWTVLTSLTNCDDERSVRMPREFWIAVSQYILDVSFPRTHFSEQLSDQIFDGVSTR